MTFILHLQNVMHNSEISFQPAFHKEAFIATGHSPDVRLYKNAFRFEYCQVPSAKSKGSIERLNFILKPNGFPATLLIHCSGDRSSRDKKYEDLAYKNGTIGMLPNYEVMRE